MPKWNVLLDDKPKITLSAKTADEAVAYAAAYLCIPLKRLTAVLKIEDLKPSQK